VETGTRELREEPRNEVHGLHALHDALGLRGVQLRYHDLTVEHGSLIARRVQRVLLLRATHRQRFVLAEIITNTTNRVTPEVVALRNPEYRE
jgi:hypothetical protein